MAALAFGALLVGLVAAALRWPTSQSPLDCPVSEIGWVELQGADGGGYAVCAGALDGGPLPTGVALTLGRKLDLNLMSAEDLTLLPGIGPSLARTIVLGRSHLPRGFTSWEQVDALPGIGPSKLSALQEVTVLGQ
jgi:competence protein ComEA